MQQNDCWAFTGFYYVEAGGVGCNVTMGPAAFGADRGERIGKFGHGRMKAHRPGALDGTRMRQYLLGLLELGD
jgi:hypothetical protein